MGSNPGPTNSQKKTRTAFVDRLPLWASACLRSPRAWKTWFRCWLSCWISLVIILPEKSLKTLGTSSFFALLCSLLLPPALPFQMFFFLISTMVIGILAGWAIGVAAMRAALASRDQALLLASFQKVKAGAIAAGLTNPTQALTSSIFHGEFLDTKSSVVFACFLGLGTFIFGVIRAYSPKLIFFSIFGTIALDIFCTFGPLFPTARYTLINSLLTSIGCYVAIALVVTTFIFPESMNHVCLTNTSDLLGRIKTMISIHDTMLKSLPQDMAPDSPLMTKLTAIRTSVITGTNALMAKSAFINLEFSVGKWNGDDVRSLEKPLLAIVSRGAGLQSFAILVGRGSNITGIDEKPGDDHASSSSIHTTTATTNSHDDTRLLHQIHLANRELEGVHSIRIEDILPILEASTRDLRTAVIEGIGAAKDSIDLVNTRRWRRQCEVDAAHTRKLDEAFESLQAALTSFKVDKRHVLLEPFLGLLRNSNTWEEREALPLRSLYLSYVFSANLMSVAVVTLQFMDQVRELNSTRKHNRLWAPKELRAVAKLFTQRADREEAALGEEPQPASATAAEEHDEASYRRDPDSEPATNVVQKVGSSTHLLWKWARTPEALFIFKYVFLSVVLFIPAVVKSSAHFYYVQKGVWALIMAQTTLNIYVSDQMYNHFVRLLGTFVGLCLGLVTWYVGNGSGYSAYGLAASSAVFLAPIVWLRLYIPAQHLIGVALACATFSLVVGYSQIDGHLVQVASPGVGWSVAWKRWTLVLIGSVASFIVMVIPPKSGRKAVRVRNAYAIKGLSNIYSFLMSHWISATRHERLCQHDEAPAAWILDFRLRLVAQAEQITYLKQMTSMARWEGNIRGRWPVEEYTRLVNTQASMIVGLAQLGGALGQMSDEWRQNFIHNPRVLNPIFIGDVMSIFSLVSQSLRTGEPMHQVLPHSLIDRLFHHNRTYSSLAPNSEKIDVISFEEVQSVQYMYYATALVAVYQILQALDELHRITKGLCGEVPLIGFERWRDEYERAHTK